MSLNKFTDVQIGRDLKLDIGCENLNCVNCTCESMIIPNGGDLTAHDITVNNNLIVKTDDSKDLNYKTPDLGLSNYSLHTDGIGNVFWSPDDTGSPGLTYTGTPPVTLGQHIKFKTTDATQVEQSVLIESATDLDINELNIKNASRIETKSDNFNVFIGYEAGKIQTLKTNLNTLIGYQSGSLLDDTSIDNVAIGAYSLQNTVNGCTENTAIGEFSLKSINTGSTLNTGIGNGAGATLTSGSENTFIGGSCFGPVNGSRNNLFGKIDNLGNSDDSIIIGNVSNGGNSATQQCIIGNTTNPITIIRSPADNTTDLGSVTHKFKDAYLSSANISDIKTVNSIVGSGNNNDTLNFTTSGTPLLQGDSSLTLKVVQSGGSINLQTNNISRLTITDTSINATRPFNLGGNALNGSTTASGTLVLDSTSNITKGSILTASNLVLGNTRNLAPINDNIALLGGTITRFNTLYTKNIDSSNGIDIKYNGVNRISMGGSYTNILNLPINISGQILHGNSSASGNLSLSSTYNATKGKIILLDDVDLTDSKNIIPTADMKCDIGTSSLRMNTIYTESIDSGDSGLFLKFNGTTRFISGSGGNNFYAGLNMNGNNLIGAVSAGGNLTLSSTTNATKGNIICNDAVELKGDFIFQQASVEGYVDNNVTETVITATNTPTRISFGSFVSNMATGFTVDTVTNIGRITYTGTRTRVFHMGATLSVTNVSNNQQTAFYVYYWNGATLTKLPGSTVKLFNGNNAGETGSTAIHKYVTMATNDYFELWGENNTSVSNFTVTDCNIFAVGLPNTA